MEFSGILNGFHRKRKKKKKKKKKKKRRRRIHFKVILKRIVPKLLYLSFAVMK